MIQITLDSLEELREYYQLFEVRASETNLTNVFIWRHRYDFHYDIICGFLWIINVRDDQGFDFFQPIGDYDSDEALLASINEAKIKYGRMLIKKCDTRMINILQKNMIEFEMIEDRDAFDYLFDMKELMELNGKKFHKKKTHVNKFLKKYPDWDYEILDEENIEAVMGMSDRWFHERGVEDNPDYQAEKRAIDEALTHRESLDYNGGVLKVGGRVVAFTLGEKLNKETLVIHIEKADTDYHGSYAMINQQYLINQSHIYNNVNREQDLGIEGLRKAKMSYHPSGFIEKFVLKI